MNNDYNTQDKSFHTAEGEEYDLSLNERGEEIGNITVIYDKSLESAPYTITFNEKGATFFFIDILGYPPELLSSQKIRFIRSTKFTKVKHMLGSYNMQTKTTTIYCDELWNFYEGWIASANDIVEKENLPNKNKSVFYPALENLLIGSKKSEKKEEIWENTKKEILGNLNIHANTVLHHELFHSKDTLNTKLLVSRLGMYIGLMTGFLTSSTSIDTILPYKVLSNLHPEMQTKIAILLSPLVLVNALTSMIMAYKIGYRHFDKFERRAEIFQHQIGDGYEFQMLTFEPK